MERTAVRAIPIDPQGRVLLLECASGDGGPPFWITPGGGIDPGEEPAGALVRELREELGWDVTPTGLGPCVWTRTHSFPWPPKGVRLHQHERFFPLWLDRSPPVREHHRTADEVLCLTDARWWSAPQITEASAQGIRFAPSRIGKFLAELLEARGASSTGDHIAHNSTPEPIDVGV
ncbi:MAG: NUDIX domain-containing protein [Planctomycetota bacterium]